MWDSLGTLGGLLELLEASENDATSEWNQELRC